MAGGREGGEMQNCCKLWRWKVRGGEMGEGLRGEG